MLAPTPPAVSVTTETIWLLDDRPRWLLAWTIHNAHTSAEAVMD